MIQSSPTLLFKKECRLCISSPIKRLPKLTPVKPFINDSKKL